MITCADLPVRNRLLAALSREDAAALAPKLERVPLTFQATLIAPHQPITHVIFPESGIVSSVADAEEGRIEIGVIGREGFVGAPVVLGTRRTPHRSVVQVPGEGLRITSDDLVDVLARHPSAFKPLGLYVQSLMIQISQTAFVNVSFDIEARLARWLLIMQDRLGSPDMPITHDYLAAMLGVRRPGVTIATHVLEGTGAIRARRGRIEVRDRDKLMDLAGDSYQVGEREHQRLMAEL